MTKEEILIMEAGIELDILVAESIMGYQVFAGMTSATSPLIITTSQVLSYSRDISAAWQVVDKLKEEKLLFIDIFWDYEAWFCRIEDIDGKTIGASELACDSAPEAICKAALLAKVKQ